jgi:formyltetrahydrofolate deformylase
LEAVILKLQCRDQKGLVAAVTQFVFRNGGNIVNLDQYTDNEHRMFFMRLEWDLKGFGLGPDRLGPAFGSFLKSRRISASWELFFPARRERMAVMVSRFDHCLFDLLYRRKAGEFACDIPVVLSNHPDLREVADYFSVPFVHIPVGEGKAGKTAEGRQLEVLRESGADFVVLARYMRILSPSFLKAFPSRIINIHHSFLPAFKGAKPYHQAWERGVKIIGATSHFVTEDLDQGPIIHQDVVKVSHKDTAEDLVIRGRDIERRVLAEAVKLYLQKRIFVNANKTYIL